MYSFIVFLLTFGQLAVLGGSYWLEADMVFYTLAVYGSPFYSAMSLFRADSVFFDRSPVYLMLLVYHIMKYLMFFLAQRNEGSSGMLTLAAAFEAAYLVTSAYYLN